MEQNKIWMTQQKLAVWSLAIIAAICISFALSYTRGILIPFIFSLFLYFMLLPLMRSLRVKFKFPRWLALAITFAIVFLIMISLALFLTTTVKAFFGGYEAYQDKLIIAIERIRSLMMDKGFDLSSFDIAQKIKELPLLNILRNTGFGALNFITKLFLVFIFLLFLFTGTKNLNNDDDDQVTNELLIEIDHNIRQYLLTKLATSSVTALIVGSFLAFMDLDFAFAFMLLVFILNFIPTIGSIIATFLPLPVALIQYPSSAVVLMIILIPGAIQFTIGSIIEPKLLGDSLKLHPVVILISLMFWSLIWGIPGAFLAVPITAVVKIIFEKIEGGKAISEVMAGNLENLGKG